MGYRLFFMSPRGILRAAAIVILLTCAGASAVDSPAGERADGELFTYTPAVRALVTADLSTVVRARFTGVDLSLLSGKSALGRHAGGGERLRLNLFDDAVYNAVFDRLEENWSGGYTWIGHIEGEEFSQVTLAVGNGVMAGNISLPFADRFYQVRYAGNGIHAIYQIDQSSFPPEEEPIPFDYSGAAPFPAADMRLLADNGSIIDVLVVYTAAARAGAGGTAAVETLINLAVAETNTSYANSGITHQLRLMHAEEVTYDESGFDWSTTLYRFRGTADGYIDNVHSLRDSYGADCAVLIVNSSSSCGIGYLMTFVTPFFESSAFSVVSRNCATGYYSFGHELGHNMGAHHDWYVESDPGAYSYSHGFVNAGDRWRTIMAYNTECYDSGFYCTRLQYWSNPDISYGGDPMGVPVGQANEADNRQTLNNAAYTVANFRDSIYTPVPTPTPTVTPTPTPVSFPLHVNYQTEPSAVPAGYIKDHGQSYGTSGTVYYGWL